MSEELINESSVAVALGRTFQGSDTEEDPLKIRSSKPWRIFLVNEAAHDPELVQACQLFNVPISFVDCIQSDQSNEFLSVYVVNSFDGVKYNEPNIRIIGRTALLEKAANEEKLDKYCPFEKLPKPLFCHALSKQVICFTGFRNRDEIYALKFLIQHMGGKVRNEADSEVTHLVAKICMGEKYTYAMAFSVPVVSEYWIQDAWENRNAINFKAYDPNFVSKYRFKLFHSCKICFFGYPEEEKIHMIEVLRENGGESVDLNDDSCTHVVTDEPLNPNRALSAISSPYSTPVLNPNLSTLKIMSDSSIPLKKLKYCDEDKENINLKVVNDSEISSAPPVKSSKPFVLKTEWFWLSIQHEYRKDEKYFKFEDLCQINNSNTPLGLSNNSLYATSSGRTRKRKRLKNNLLISGDSSPQSAQKRRSSVSDLNRLSDGSFLDYTSSSTLIEDSITSISDKSKNNKRYQKFLELWQTETNYVGILKTIMILFKAELESMVGKKDQLLNATELKIIFGHLPPIYVAHCSMLEELNLMAANWNEESSVGSLIQKYSGDLEKAYPPFINFFENTRDMLIKCDKTKPRFHAFLKLCQSKPECGRQSLQDLLIRPVQRLPSINLLLNDILRNTSKTTPDHNKLEIAIQEIQKVMTFINEDKRRTEGQVALFDIFNDIEKCPADLVSSHRCYVSRCEVTELSDDLSGKGNPLVLFLFSDVIEVCKKRAKAPNKENSSSKHGNTKLYKHVEVIPLSTIIKVIDIKETDECHHIFALMVKRNYELKEAEDKVFSFTVTDSTIEKVKFLRTLCNQIANTVCRTDTDSYFILLEAHQLDIDSSEVTTGTLGKAFNKFASKTKKVGRALSFNKTPNKLKRAVSTMMSPFGSQNGLTPSTQLANLQLAALPPIPNYSENGSLMDTPTSVQSIRKPKSSSFSMGSLRRL